MTIAETQALIAALEANITAQLQAFQASTGLTIHSVPVTENSSTNTTGTGNTAQGYESLQATRLVTAKVKVQL